MVEICPLAGSVTACTVGGDSRYASCHSLPHHLCSLSPFPRTDHLLTSPNESQATFPRMFSPSLVSAAARWIRIQQMLESPPETCPASAAGSCRYFEESSRHLFRSEACRFHSAYHARCALCSSTTQKRSKFNITDMPWAILYLDAPFLWLAFCSFPVRDTLFRDLSGIYCLRMGWPTAGP